MLGVKRLPAGAALWAILALALTLRLVAACWWQSQLAPGQRFKFGDSDTYWVLAGHIAHGEPYEYGSSDARIFRMPGYPALLAVMLGLFGDNMPVLYARFLSAALGTAAVAGVYAVAQLLFDCRTALLAALLAACYPGAIAMSVVVLSEAPFCPLYLLQLVAWLKSWQTGSDAAAGAVERASRLLAHPSAPEQARRLFYGVVSGALAGLATLMRPDWLLFVPFVGVLGLLFTHQRQRHIAIVLVMSLGLTVVMAPWWWRNYRQVHEFVPTTLQVGASLYDGLNPRATGESDMSFVPRFVAEERDRGPAERAFQSRLDDSMFAAAADWARQHPQRVIELAAIKLVRMWNIWPNNPNNRGGLLRLVTAATYLPAMVLAAIGIWRQRGKLWPAALGWLPAVYLTLLHLVFVSSIRYREPAMLGLLVFAAAALTRGGQPSSAR